MEVQIKDNQSSLWGFCILLTCSLKESKILYIWLAYLYQIVCLDVNVMETYLTCLLYL